MDVISSTMHDNQILRSLISIRNTTEDIRALTQSRVPKNITKAITPLNISIPILDLPFPSDLGPALRSLGLSDRAYSEAYHKIQGLVHNLQNLHSLKFQQACRNLASLPHFQNHHLLASTIDQIRIAYQNIYATHLPVITTHILSAQSKHSSNCNNARTPFNNEYTPLLEMYFEQNAYPSLPDRKLLAKKSMMTIRQIEVWFQNHRARARKEGKVIKKLNRPCQLQVHLDSPKERLSFFSTTDSTAKTSIDNESKDGESSEGEAFTTPPPLVLCPFSQVAPPHAFPTTYPLNLATDPFPSENGHFRFPPPIWMRTPTQTKRPTAVPDMDEFISIFASKLHLRDRSRRKCDVQHPQSAKGHKKSWFTPRVVVPAPAPHPALIRGPNIQSSSTPRPCSPINSLLPAPVSLPPNAHRPRKFVPFCKRSPSALSTNHSSKQPNAFSAFASRTCSFRSAASSQSRSSSLSSVSSAEPATPPLSPTQQEQDPLLADHDYRLLDELFGPEPSQLFNNMAYDTPDFLFPTILQKDIPHNPLYDLSPMFPPAVAQVHC